MAPAVGCGSDERAPLLGGADASKAGDVTCAEAARAGGHGHMHGAHAAELEVGPSAAPLRKRLVVAALACLMCLGPSHGFDVVGAVQAQVEERLGISHEAFSWFYTLYPLPNIAMVLVAGLTIDSFGLRAAPVAFAALVAAGAALLAAGVAARSFPAALAGRLLFSLGAEATFVSKSAILMRWLPGSSAALSASVCFIRLGSILAFSGSSAALAAAGGDVLAPLWLAAGSGALSLAAALGCAAAGSPPGPGAPRPSTASESAASALRLPRAYWALAASATLIYAAVWPFLSYSTAFLAAVYGLPADGARGAAALVPAASLALSAPLGLLVDRIGRHCLLGGASAAGLSLGFLAASSAAVPPTPLYLAVGLLFALFPAAVMPAVSLIAGPARVGTAFGLVAASMNVGWLLSYRAAGILQESPRGAPLYYAALAAASAAAAAAAAALSPAVLKRAGRGGTEAEAPLQ